MNPLSEMPDETLAGIKYALMDIDDTITTDGRLTARAYRAMEDLKESGFIVAPITGRPGGWCDHIARMWPVDAVVGENGAFYFSYDRNSRKMIRRYIRTVVERASDKIKLERIRDIILKDVPGSAVSADQQYRDADLAIDFCEDVSGLSIRDAEKISEIFTSHGAKAKVSSIHVNGWFGDYDKLPTTRLMFSELFGVDIEQIKNSVIFAGDSPNDSPMFEYFPNSVGVANLLDFDMSALSRPAWITRGRSGDGFVEAASLMLGKR